MNSIIRFFNEDINFRLPHKRLISQWIKMTIQNENRKTGNINIIFCSDEFLIRLNQQYLNEDNFTDIITFDFSEHNVVSGDLYISLPRVKENSGIFNRPFSEEIHRVIIHGILHLCGYEDKNNQHQEIMHSKENHYLNLRPSQLKC